MIFTQSENDKGSKNTEQDLSSLDYYVENMERLCFILNRNGERVYSTDGKFQDSAWQALSFQLQR